MSDQTFVEIFAFTICAIVIILFVGLFTGCITLEQPYNKSGVTAQKRVKDGKQSRGCVDE